MTIDYSNFKAEFLKKDKEIKREQLKAKVQEILIEREIKARSKRS